MIMFILYAGMVIFYHFSIHFREVEHVFGKFTSVSYRLLFF